MWLRNMLRKSKPQYAYKRYAYKKYVDVSVRESAVDKKMGTTH